MHAALYTVGDEVGIVFVQYLLPPIYIFCFVTKEDGEQAPAQSENDGAILQRRMFVDQI